MEKEKKSIFEIIHLVLTALAAAVGTIVSNL